MPRSLTPIKDRFNTNTTKTVSCWLWIGPKYYDGYGLFLIKNREGKWTGHAAHRISYQLFVGQIPYGLLVCHSCDNPSCVNPTHLFLGTHQDNTDDKCKKGRQRGPSRKLHQ